MSLGAINLNPMIDCIYILIRKLQPYLCSWRVVVLPALIFVSMTFFNAILAHAAISLVYPAPKTAITRSDHLIIKLNNLDFTGIKIVINGVDSDLLPVGSPEYRRAFQDFVVLQPVWDKGKNVITIEAYKAALKDESVNAEVFYAPKSEAIVIPAEFSTGFIHTVETERQCVACHNMSPTLAQVNTSVGKSNPCYTCHKKILNADYVHGPTGTFSCAYCHALQGNPKYSTPKRDILLCGECHVEKVKQFKGLKMRHGPVDAGMCELCHDPHGSNTIAQLKMPINKLCLSCHEQIGVGIHVNRSTYGGGHPLSGKPDKSPKGKGRELSCVSCHDPHGGNFRYYFQGGMDNRMDLCQYCHNK